MTLCPFPYFKTPATKAEAQSNCNHWTWIKLGGCPEGESLPAWRTYLESMEREARRVRAAFN